MFIANDLMIEGPDGQLSVRSKGLAPGRPAVVLIQGANMSGQMGYDFRFAGGEDYSLMDAVAGCGFAAVTFSVRGYARSELSHDPFGVQTEQAIDDLAAVVRWLDGEGFSRPHLVGWSWGGRIAGRYVETNADDVDRLVMLDPALGGGARVVPAPTDPWWANTYDYFHDRLETQWTDEPARIALGERMAAEEPRSPNGIRMENAQGSTRVQAALMVRPTLMLYGEGAGLQTYMQGGVTPAGFFDLMPTSDKSLVIIPGGGDYAHLQHARHRLARLTLDFLQAS